MDFNDRSNDKKIALVIGIIVFIWFELFFLYTTKVIKPDLDSIESLEKYLLFMQKLIYLGLPMIALSISIIPLVNDDTKVVSYVSMILLILATLLIVFSKDMNSKPIAYATKFIIADIGVLIIFATNSTGQKHLYYKIGLACLFTISIFLNMKSTSEITDGSMLIQEESKIDIPLNLLLISIGGILINPAMALILDEGVGKIVGSAEVIDGNRDAKRLESPLELYKRLCKERKEKGLHSPEDDLIKNKYKNKKGGETPVESLEAAPAAPSEPAVATPTPTETVATMPATNVAPVPAVNAAPVASQAPVTASAGTEIGPNSGAVINPIAQAKPAESAPAAPSEPAVATPATPAPAAAQPSSQEFQVPPQMAFLFDSNNDQNGESK